MKLASLFSGSGGFELAGMLVGIEPVWASEIEPFPIRVTTKRFPNMKHYGDVSKIDGAKVEPVDIITFGSPCQDLSIAGKRAGMEDGLRSNLFYQAVRIINEMRKETNGKYPRYAVWENVPGAYSSNDGEDFKSVLETLARVKDGSVSVPKAVWGGQGLILGDGYSICWRTLDAQYWGVPQRRKRIFLVADFDGWRAEEILFKSEGVSRYSAESFRTWQRLANGTPDSTGESSKCVMVENHPADSRVRITDDGKSQTLDARMGMGGGNTPLVMEQMEQYTTAKPLKVRCGKDGGGKGALVQDEKSATLSCNNDQTLFVPFVKTARARTPEEISTFEQKEVANTLNTFDIGETRCNEMVVALEGNGARPSHKGTGYSEEDKSFTLNTIEQHGVAVKTYSYVPEYFTDIGEEKATALKARDWKDVQIINDKKPIGFDAFNQLPTGDKAMPITHAASDPHHIPCVATDEKPYGFDPNACRELGQYFHKDKANTIANGTNPGFHNGVAQPTFGIGRDAFNMGKDAKFGMSIDEEVRPPMTARGAGAVSSDYVVRRLTPTECARLQGFPDWWAHDLGTKHITEDDIKFWADVWNTWCDINNLPHKKENAIRSWLHDPYSDAAEYKMWGNGVALPCVTFVLAGIEWADRTNQEGEEPIYDRQISIFDM